MRQHVLLPHVQKHVDSCFGMHNAAPPARFCSFRPFFKGSSFLQCLWTLNEFSSFCIVFKYLIGTTEIQSCFADLYDFSLKRLKVNYNNSNENNTKSSLNHWHFSNWLLIFLQIQRKYLKTSYVIPSSSIIKFPKVLLAKPYQISYALSYKNNCCIVPSICIIFIPSQSICDSEFATVLSKNFGGYY